MIYIVLGMHKSGTTLLARALHESGIVMGQEFPYGATYTEAKYEARWVQEINDALLGADRKKVSLHVNSKLLPTNDIDESLKNKIKEGIDNCQARYKDWGFKDPRTTLTYQYWKEFLPEHRLVIVYRNPLEVWKRYSGFNRNPLTLTLPFKTWCDYNRKILEYVDQLKQGQYICLSFERMLTDSEEWQRLNRFVGINLKDVRNQKQSVNRLPVDVRQSLGYRALRALAGAESDRIYKSFEDLRSETLK